MKNIKIFLSHHKPSATISSKIFEPIHVGRRLATQEIRQSLAHIIGDDTGDNISEKNKTYCELTAQYWAWKNCDADYIGFMHYRRHLNFKLENLAETNIWGLQDYPSLDKNYLYRCGLYDSFLNDFVPNYDIITVKPWDVTNAGSKSNYDHYENSDTKLHIKDYNFALKLLGEFYPDYISDAQLYNASRYGYYTNIFIMRREIFKDYCEFLFKILFELERNLDISSYDFQEGRVFGYISEWLFGIYITHQKRLGKLKIKELERTFIKDTNIEETGDIHVCLSSDDKYSMPLGVTLTSILVNRNPKDRLYFYVIDGGITEGNKKRLENFVHSYQGAYLYFLDSPSEDLSLLSKTVETSHLSLTGYYRLFLDELLPSYLNKIIYLDSDLIVKSSLKPLYDWDFESKIILGVHDVLESENCQRLGLKKYINSGVLCFDLDKYIQFEIGKKCREYIRSNVNNIVWHDQDVLNATANDVIGFLPDTWNAQTSSYAGCEKQNQLAFNAQIVHFISDRKPWIEGSNSPFEDLFKTYYEQSPLRGQRLYKISGKSNNLRRGLLFQKLSRLSSIILPYGSNSRKFVKKMLGL